MSTWTRRGFIAATAASLTACTERSAPTAAEIDQRVAASRQRLFNVVPGADGLMSRAAGVLIIPGIKEAGFVFSGAYGEGSLMIQNAVVDYMSVSALAIGFQIGAQEYDQALFFMTEQSLRDFRVTDGWQLGVNAEVAVLEEGAAVNATTNTVSKPVYEVIYGQRGLIVGASLEGAKYSRLIR